MTTFLFNLPRVALAWIFASLSLLLASGAAALLSVARMLSGKGDEESST